MPKTQSKGAALRTARQVAAARGVCAGSPIKDPELAAAAARVSTAQPLTPQARACFAVAAFESGLALRDVVAALRGAAERTPAGASDHLRGVQERICGALAQPIADWAALEAVFANASLVLRVCGSELRPRVSVQCDTHGSLGGVVIRALDCGPEPTERARRLLATFRGAATPRDLALERVVANWEAPKRAPLCTPSLAWFAATAAKIQARRAALPETGGVAAQ